MTKIAIIFAVFFASSNLVHASPPIKISGKVTDETDSPLPGVSILLKGTRSGTTTDQDGNYSLEVPDQTSVLVFSFIGYQLQEVTVGDRVNINLKLLPDITSLNEVVVIGYGTQKKSDMAGAFSSVSTKDMGNLPVSRVDQALQGRAPGVLIQNNDASPNGNVSIRIRGANSLTGSNDPLIVINGFIGGDLSSINPNDIESLEVLKDASATAIYGSRGANGVILITTKKGTAGKTIVQYNTFLNFVSLRKKLDLMNAGQYAETINENRIESGSPAVFTADQIASYKANGGTDWQDQIFQNALQQNHQLSASGGNDKVGYFVSGNYVNNGGIIKNTSFKRYSIRSNIKADINDNLEVGMNLFLSTSVDHPTTLNSFSGGNTGSPVYSARLWAPTASVYDENGNYTLPSAVGAHYLYNPLAYAVEPINDYKQNITEFNAYGEYTIIEGLSVRIMGGGRLTDSENSYYFNTKPSGTGDAQAGITNSKYVTLQNTNQINYQRLFGEHNLNVTVVYEQQSEEFNTSFAGSKGYLTDALTYNNLLLGASTSPSTSDRTKKTIQSYLGRIIYSFKDTYILNVAGRYDGASVFSDNNKYGFFPSAAFAWRLNKESFLQGVEQISNLKLRASYGITGNQGVQPYQSLEQLETVLYPLNGVTLNPGATLGSPGNPNLKWEKTAQLDIGVDIGLFEDKVTLSADYYRKKTNDLLINTPLPQTSGYSYFLKNVGEVENKGIEISLGVKPFTGAVSWSTNFNLAINRNKVLALDGADEVSLGGPGLPNFGNTIFLKVGEPMGILKGLIQDGVWGTAEEDLATTFGTIPGAPKYVDQDNNGQINDKDIVVMGNTTPKFTFGWTNTFTFKNFDLNILINGVQGNKIYNLGRVYMDKTTGDADGTSVVLLDRWTPDHQNTNVPSFTGGKNESLQTSRWLEDGSYIRFKNITLGYNLPGALFKNKIGGARLFFSGVNLITITDYTGYDPEARISDATGQQTNIDTRSGIDLATYPSQKTYTVGLNVTF